MGSGPSVLAALQTSRRRVTSQQGQKLAQKDKTRGAFREMALHMGATRRVGIANTSQQGYEVYQDLLTSKLHLKTLLPGRGLPQGLFHSSTGGDHQWYHHNPMVIKLATVSGNQAVSSPREKLMVRSTGQLKSHGTQGRHTQSRCHFLAFWAGGVTERMWLGAEVNDFPWVNGEPSPAG